LFVENFTDTRVNMVPITQANANLLRSDYEARVAGELPVYVSAHGGSYLMPAWTNDLSLFLSVLVATHLHRLVRWFPSHSVTPRVAEYLDIILYSREQIRKENAATDRPNSEEHEEAPWGIVSIKAQEVDHELPMKPITMMRNALGKEEGGSGVPIDRDEYLKSVEFWKKHAIVQ
jgi:hypothetical protein